MREIPNSNCICDLMFSDFQQSNSVFVNLCSVLVIQQGWKLGCSWVSWADTEVVGFLRIRQQREMEMHAFYFYFIQFDKGLLSSAEQICVQALNSGVN